MDSNRYVPDSEKFKRADTASTQRGKGSARSVSNFMVTINTNKVADSETTYLAIANRLTTGVTKFFRNSTNWLSADDPLRIQGREVYVAVEIGPNTGRVHCHACVRVYHSTKVRINIPRMRVFFNNHMGYRPYINVKGSGGPRDFGKKRTIDYISKKLKDV